jgi:anti-anti-sigma regulatory factor
MDIEIVKEDQYVVIKPLGIELNDEITAKIEKSIAGFYGSEGRINFILDLLGISSISDSAVKLFQKVQKICANESGLFVLVNTNDDLIDEVSGKCEEFILFLPSVEEAIDGVFMNELENDFKDEHEDEFGGTGENDY